MDCMKEKEKKNAKINKMLCNIRLCYNLNKGSHKKERSKIPLCLEHIWLQTTEAQLTRAEYWVRGRGDQDPAPFYLLLLITNHDEEPLEWCRYQAPR